MCKQLGVYAFTGKRVIGDIDSIIKEYNLFCNYSSGFDDFSILARNRDHPPLNKNRHLPPLELFDDWGKLFYHMIAVDWSDCSPLIPDMYCFIKWMAFNLKRH